MGGAACDAARGGRVARSVASAAALRALAWLPGALTRLYASYVIYNVCPHRVKCTYLLYLAWSIMYPIIPCWV